MIEGNNLYLYIEVLECFSLIYYTIKIVKYEINDNLINDGHSRVHHNIIIIISLVSKTESLTNVNKCSRYNILNATIIKLK